MRLFPLDLLAGSLVVLSLISLMISIYVLRYRGGPGPVVMIISSTLILLSSSYSVLLSLDLLEGGLTPFFIGLAVGVLGIITSVVIWRRSP